MNNKEINELIEGLKLDEMIEPQSIPNLDLYMDQVITLFEEKLAHTKRNTEDKLLTKTMINNYAKDKLLMPAKKKKYTREHIILMILLYELKQILTISDIKDLFGTIVKDDQVDAEKLEEIYLIYLSLKKQGINDFKGQVDKVSASLEEQLEHSNLKELTQLSITPNDPYDSEDAWLNNKETETQKTKEEKKSSVEDMLMVIMLTQKANYYKRLAEKIIDNKIKAN